MALDFSRNLMLAKFSENKVLSRGRKREDPGNEVATARVISYISL